MSLTPLRSRSLSGIVGTAMLLLGTAVLMVLRRRRDDPRETTRWRRARRRAWHASNDDPLAVEEGN